MILGLNLSLKTLFCVKNFCCRYHSWAVCNHDFTRLDKKLKQLESQPLVRIAGTPASLQVTPYWRLIAISVVRFSVAQFKEKQTMYKKNELFLRVSLLSWPMNPEAQLNGVFLVIDLKPNATALLCSQHFTIFLNYQEFSNHNLAFGHLNRF